MLQRNISWSDFGLLVVNDGYDISLPDEFAGGWPWRIRQIWTEHGGISHARNAGLDASDADWIMFCDSDDAFWTTTSLQIFLEQCGRTDKMLVTGGFCEEVLRPDGTMRILRHDGKDYIFVHAKMFRRKWLTDNRVRFCDRILLHEDVYFISLASFLLRDEEILHLPDYLYLWQWNRKSVTRADGVDFTLKTYNHLCIKNAALVDELLRRGMYMEAKGVVLYAVTDAYNHLQRKTWNLPENREKAQRAERDIASFLRRYDYIFKTMLPCQTEQSVEKTRKMLIRCGEIDADAGYQPFDEWLRHVREDVEPSLIVY